ncbi:MAG: Hint domain-containing protein [Litoreibacter sp.]|nr:Hint domain-containing protein [Litoreibacter sp.]
MPRPFDAYDMTPRPFSRPISVIPRTGPKRSYEIAWQDEHGHSRFDTVLAPTDPILESTIANVARGAVILTDTGNVPVEDLNPGDMIQTVEFGPLPVRWIGSYVVLPGSSDPQRAVTRLVRFSSDAFGLAKPSADLLLSESAHLLLKDAKCQPLYGLDQAYAPARAFEDGAYVFSITPAAPVTVFNLAFDRHATIVANGIEIESFHPGPLVEFMGDNQMRVASMRLFPHIASLQQFGERSTQRLTVYETSQLRQAG